VTARPGAYEEKIHVIHSAEIPPAQAREFVWDFAPTSGWYDLKVKVGDFEQRLAGCIEDGSSTTSDPAMGGPARMAWV
jgi:phospholipase C